MFPERFDFPNLPSEINELIYRKVLDRFIEEQCQKLVIKPDLLVCVLGKRERCELRKKSYHLRKKRKLRKKR